MSELTLADVLLSLYPATTWIVRDDEIEWLENEPPIKPTQEELDVELARLQAQEKVDDMREERNRLLADSDFSQLPDAPVNRNEWATYRQALRDLPSTVDINNPVYPEKP
jgi:hypothetical protein